LKVRAIKSKLKIKSIELAFGGNRVGFEKIWGSRVNIIVKLL